ncbi:hypothetical protein LCGC14_1690470, partial [marine sediment metagenome]
YYTDKEGGPWLLWPKEIEFTGEDLNKERFARIRRKQLISITAKLSAHSLAFDDPALGFGNFPRWDYINGWTDRVKYA